MNNKLSYITVVLITICLIGCTPKRNTAVTRNYQAFITRYNVYFNGKEHFEETLESLEKEYDDDFSRLLPIHPADVRGSDKYNQPTGSFTRAIEKAQKAIQLRSIKRKPKRQPGRKNDREYQEWLRREEYNPFIHNAWMLLAESQFMEGDFLGSASTFFYIANHFNWLPATVTEARIWQARAYCAAGRVNEADATLRRVKEKDLTNGNLRGLYAFVRADIDLAKGNIKEAADVLPVAIKWSSGRQSQRLTYLLGQLYLRLGKYEEARETMRKLEQTPSAPQPMRFNARIRRSEAIVGGKVDIDIKKKELKSLLSLAKYESNANYLDQIYYGVGNIYKSLNDTVNAIDAYSKAIKMSERKSTDMAIAQIALSELYMGRGEYDKAQPYLAEAVVILPENYPEYIRLKETSDILDHLAVFSTIINSNDSLLHLSTLPEKEIYAIIDAKIERLKQEERQRNLDMQLAQSVIFESVHENNHYQPIGNSDGAWYFYSSAVREAGKKEFRRRWGNRKPDDNWRRLNKNNSFSIPEENPSPAPEESSILLETNVDPYAREYYLTNIPFDQQDKNRLLVEISDALYDMGFVLKDELEDFNSTSKAWGRFVDDYPEDGRNKEIYYNLYLMAMRQGHPVEADKWRKALLRDFPESREAIAMKDPRYFDNLREMNLRQEQLYEETYRKYLLNDNPGVRENVAYAREHYPLSHILPKYIFLEALTYLTENNTGKFKSLLGELSVLYPDAELTPLTQSWLSQIESGREVKSGERNMRGWLDTKLVEQDSVVVSRENREKLNFSFDNETPHYVLLTFPLNQVEPNNFLFEVARWNFSNFVVRDFELSMLKFGNLGILRIADLSSKEEAEKYLRMLGESGSGILEYPIREVVISEADFNLLLHGGYSLSDYIDTLEHKIDEEVHESVLPKEEYPTASELYGDDIADDVVEDELEFKNIEDE